MQHPVVIKKAITIEMSLHANVKNTKLIKDRGVIRETRIEVTVFSNLFFIGKLKISVQIDSIVILYAHVEALASSKEYPKLADIKVPVGKNIVSKNSKYIINEIIRVLLSCICLLFTQQPPILLDQSSSSNISKNRYIYDIFECIKD